MKKKKKEKSDTLYLSYLFFLQIRTISRLCISCNGYLNVKLNVIIEEKN